MSNNLRHLFIITNIKKIIWLIGSLILIGCAAEKNNPMSNSYHNLTAHYNAYFIANERLKEIENVLEQNQKPNYDSILYVFPQFDTTLASAAKTQIKDCFEKASLAIQLHKGSNWEDDSYLLIGKVRFYSSEFPEAIETFKYINTHSKNESLKHKALSNLMKTFVEYKEYNNAQAVVDYLEKEELDNDNKRLFHLNAAYFYQKTNRTTRFIKHLKIAIDFLKNKEKAKFHFILGQLYQQTKNDKLAYFHYKNVLKHNPTYELSFYTKLYLAQVTNLNNSSNLDDIRVFFKKMLKDSKNKEYLGKIYYEMGNFELKNGNIQNAIENYKTSTRQVGVSNLQKGLSFWEIGKIYFDVEKKYPLSKVYYDSTVSTLPKNTHIYPKIEKKSKILTEFVKHFLIIQKNDSLLSLSRLPEDSVKLLFTNLVKLKVKKEKEKKEREKKEAARRFTNLNSQNQTLIGNSKTWYFANAASVSRGVTTFNRVWGDIKLEDNWRRLNKKINTNSKDTNNISSSTEETNSKENEPKKEINIDKQVESMLSQIPKSNADKQKLNKEIEDAMFEIGKIYKFQLIDKASCISTYNTFLKRFPNTEYEPEVLYQLYLTHEDKFKKEQIGQLILKKYPDSIYAKLVKNPSYKEEDFMTTNMLKKQYKQLYKAYENGSADNVILSINQLLEKYPDNSFSDNLALLKALAIGKNTESFKYQFELSNFIEKYPDSELQDYAKSLLSAAIGFQEKRINSAAVKFYKSPNQIHYFMVAYKYNESTYKSINKLLEDYIKNNGFNTLEIGSLTLNENTATFMISQFPGKNSALTFKRDIQKQIENEIKQVNEVFVISKDNFEILFKTKELDAYMKFHKKRYAQ